MQAHAHIAMDAYEDLRSLGRGAFASVRLVKRKKDGMLMVVKRFHVPMSELTPKERSEVAQEVKLVAHLRHPNVIAFKENFVENGVMHIMMEFATGGTLHKKIQEREGELFPEVGTGLHRNCMQSAGRHLSSHLCRTKSGRCSCRSSSQCDTSTPATSCTET